MGLAAMAVDPRDLQNAVTDADPGDRFLFLCFLAKPAAARCTASVGRSHCKHVARDLAHSVSQPANLFCCGTLNPEIPLLPPQRLAARRFRSRPPGVQRPSGGLSRAGDRAVKAGAASLANSGFVSNCSHFACLNAAICSVDSVCSCVRAVSHPTVISALIVRIWRMQEWECRPGCSLSVDDVSLTVVTFLSPQAAHRVHRVSPLTEGRESAQISCRASVRDLVQTGLSWVQIVLQGLVQDMTCLVLGCLMARPPSVKLAADSHRQPAKHHFHPGGAEPGPT